MPPLKDATSGSAVVLHQTDAGGSSSAGAPFESQVYQTISQQIDSITDFANNTLPTIQSDLQAQSTDMQTQIDTWIAGINDNLSKSQSNGRLVVLHTTSGTPSVFWRCPAMTCEQLVPSGEIGTGMHPAFMQGATQAKALYIAAFQLSNVNGEAVSLPFSVPWVGVSYNEAVAACAGTVIEGYAGHRLWSCWDRAVVIFDSVRSGAVVRGNNNYGSDYADSYVNGEFTGVSSITRTGSMGPQSSHTGQTVGVYDLNGNVGEFISGVKLGSGRVVMSLDNADPVNNTVGTQQYFSTSDDSATSGRAGSPFIVNSLAAQSVNSGTAYDSIDDADGFAQLPGGNQIMKSAALAPVTDSPIGGVKISTHGVCVASVGGGFNSGIGSGISKIVINVGHDTSWHNSGFRSAFLA